MAENMVCVDVDSVLSKLCHIIEGLSEEQRIDEINKVKIALHRISPHKNEPVDCVIWVKAESVTANDYNPNSVAPPEMELLRLSIAEDGYTQPIVTFKEQEKREVVDGFHRNRVGRECPDINLRVRGYLPVVTINQERGDKCDRISATVRHNRARGKHRVEAMADIVMELKRRNWSSSRISKNLGMDEDEVLRLCQITGMAEAFSDVDFSKSWDIGFEEDLSEIKFEDAEGENEPS